MRIEAADLLDEGMHEHAAILDGSRRPRRQQGPAARPEPPRALLWALVLWLSRQAWGRAGLLAGGALHPSSSVLEAMAPTPSTDALMNDRRVQRSDMVPSSLSAPPLPPGWHASSVPRRGYDGCDCDVDYVSTQWRRNSTTISDERWSPHAARSADATDPFPMAPCTDSPVKFRPISTLSKRRRA